MASSLLTGDRRWAPTRKSGMTVLGKVPKPINLPSQRLENHGLDPNVEIVPKGTHTWGSSRQSSAAPNAWGSSNLSSPNTDGSAGSPSHVNGRPSSGGSGTRPSTAGSDRSHEPASNAWGPNLRPSSASGILASNQISQTAGRPRSAETRPGSSQLSRFAENAVDTPVVWGATGTVERLGSFSSKTNSFTLSSGDFPTLGSEKSSDSQTQRGHSSQGRPASSSDAISAKKETLGPELAGNKNSDISVQGKVNTWRAENHPSLAHSAPPNVENWQKDPHQGQSYPHSDVPPHQFESWHNAPSHPSNGVWYRGGPAGGLYRPPGPPGNYPVEPYYPHVPARPLPNVQSFPRPEAGPAGYHPKNGDSYRPHMPLEAYMVPSHSAIPIRPGVFQGPVPYEGYYGPPHRGFSISSDREGPVMGMAARPGVYNQYPTQNVNIDPGHFHGRPGGYSPVMNKEQMKSDNAYETQGQYRVLLKQHDSWEDHGQREKGEQAVISGSPHIEKGNQPVSTRDGDWRTDSTEGGNQPVSTRDGDWRTDSRKHEPAPLQPASGREGYSSDTIVRNSSLDSSKVAGDNMTRKSVTGTVQIRNIQQYPVTKKNATLMEKVEGLNSKARITDSHSETGIVSSKGKTKNFKDVSSSADRFGKVICATAAPAESASSIGLVKPIPCEAIASTGDGSEVSSTDQNISSGPSESQAYVLSKSKTVEAGENTHFQHQKRTSTRGVDHPAKLRSSRHDNDEWMKKSTARDSSANNIVKNGESKPGTYVSEYHPSQEATDRQELHVAGSVVGGSYSASPLDSFDQKAQRAKIKEIAIQRAKQLQEEEEERTREQKAKALAKLEELNRRSLAESSNLKSNNVATPSNDILNKSEADAGSAPVADATLTEAPSSTLACDSEAARKKSDVGESAELPPHETAQALDSATQTFIVPQNQFMSMGQDKKTTEITEKMTDIHDIAGSRQKQMGYRRRQNTPQEKHLDEKQATLENTESPKYVGKVASNAPSSDTLPGSEDPSVQHRKKNNRGTRNRNKRDESMLSPSRSSAQTESTSEKRVIESGNTKPSETLAVAVSGPDERLNETGRTQVSKNAVAAPSRTTTNQEWSDSTEEIHGKASNHWKPHPHRKSNRGQQAHKPVTKHHGTEAVIWAPVRTANKNEPSEKVNQTSMSDTTNRSPGKVGHDMHNGVKVKRAEIERYVPKPVAKELSQGNSQQTLSRSQTASDDSGIPEPVSPRGGSGKSDALTVGKASFASDTKNGEGSKHNQYGRTQASWRQRGSAESLSPQNLVEGAFDTTKVVQKGSDQLQPSKIDSLQARQPDDWNGDNDSATPGESETIAVAKNEGTSRQRHHPYKTHRVAGGNYAAADNKNLQRGMANRIDTQPPVSSLKSENQNSSGDHIKSHWQPKPQTHTYYGRQGNRSSGGQRVGYSDKELPLPGPVNNMQNEDNSEPSQETVGGEARGADAAKRERKTVPDLSKEQTSSLNQDFPSTGESGRANFDPQQAQSYPSEVHRRGQYNDRFQRGQDVGRQTLEVNGDKRKNNQNLEYQPVGSYHKPSESQNLDAGEEAHKGPRYRERGRLNPRGGGGGRHFYGRSGGARVGDYHDGRE